MAGRSRQRGGKGSPRRSLTMAECKTALANLKPAQRNSLFRLFPERVEPAKLPARITRRQLLALWQGLEALMDTPSRSVEFSYAVIQNRVKMVSEIGRLDKAKEPSDAWKAFDAERIAVCEEFADKDAQGKPIHDGEKYVIPSERSDEFKARAAAVRATHKEAIEAYQAQAAAYDKLLDGEITCPKFVLIPMRALPVGITPRQLEPLQIILE